MNNIFELENNELFHRVDNYLYEKLNTEEKTTFEAELANNQDLQDELDRQRLEHQALKMLAKEQLRKNLSQWKQEKEDAKPEAKIIQMPQRSAWRWAAAAAIMAIMFIGGQRWATSNYSDEALALAYTKTVDAGTSRNANATENDLLSQAKAAMQSKLWSNALNILNQINQEEQKGEVMLLQARCDASLNDYDKAIQTYQTIIATIPAQKEAAEWNLLLTYLAEGKHSDEVTKISQTILNNPKHFYNTEKNMKALDKQLNSFWRKLANL